MKKDKVKLKNRILSALIWIGLWQLLFAAVGRDYIIPSPFSVLKAFISLFSDAGFYKDAAATFSRVLLGIALSAAAGSGLALLTHGKSLLRSFFDIPSAVFKAMPVTSIIMFALLSIRSGFVPVFACFLMCFPVFYTNMLEGLDAMPLKYLQFSQIYGIEPSKRLFAIELPWCRPYFAAALSLCAGLSWKVTVAAELLCGPKLSMGYHILLAKTYLEADELFAWTAAIIIFSVCFEKILRRTQDGFAGGK